MSATGNMSEKERRAFNKGLDVAARVAMLWSDENFRMADDTIKCDPMINGTATRTTLAEDFLKAEALAVEGHMHASIAHACKDLAAMIRGQKIRR